MDAAGSLTANRTQESSMAETIVYSGESGSSKNSFVPREESRRDGA